MRTTDLLAASALLLLALPAFGQNTGPAGPDRAKRRQACDWCDCACYEARDRRLDSGIAFGRRARAVA